MTYSLVALFLLTSDTYVERENLSLQSCAGHAAMARSQMLVVLPQLNKRIGEVRYLCVPERSLARTATDTHAIGGAQ